MRLPAPALLALAIGLALPCAPAVSAEKEGWSGTGELGLSAARGNSRSENLNARLAFQKEEESWTHRFSLAGVRARGEVTADFDGDGFPETRLQTTANRYQAAASSALKMNERASWISSLRYERDDFATYDYQATIAVGYGYKYLDTEATRLAASIGPGYRRARRADTGEVEGEAIVRGTLEFARQLTETTRLVNDTLVESGSDNTFAQNDLGVAVAINSAMALKVGLQARYNSRADEDRKSTETLTTLNLVYSFF
jgi:putative salt-induced outer membrane protein